MKNTIIYSDLLLGNFTIQDLIYFLQDILNDLDNETFSNATIQKIKEQLQFIINVLEENI